MTYDEIVSAAKAYADRQDIEVDSNMDVFILMVESRANRLLKTREQAVRSYTPTTSETGFYPLPPDYSGMRDIQINAGLPNTRESLSKTVYISPELMNDYESNSYSGSKIFYTIIANQLQFYPELAAGGTIEIVYYRRIPNLTADRNSNWLSESHPDIYVSGLMGEIESFTKNYEVAKGWYAKVADLVSELTVSDVEERWTGAQLVTRIEQ